MNGPQSRLNPVYVFHPSPPICAPFPVRAYLSSHTLGRPSREGEPARFLRILCVVLLQRLVGGQHGPARRGRALSRAPVHVKGSRHSLLRRRKKMYVDALVLETELDARCVSFVSLCVVELKVATSEDRGLLQNAVHLSLQRNAALCDSFVAREALVHDLQIEVAVGRPHGHDNVLLPLCITSHLNAGRLVWLVATRNRDVGLVAREEIQARQILDAMNTNLQVAVWVDVVSFFDAPAAQTGQIWTQQRNVTPRGAPHPVCDAWQPGCAIPPCQRQQDGQTYRQQEDTVVAPSPQHVRMLGPFCLLKFSGFRCFCAMVVAGGGKAVRSCSGSVGLDWTVFESLQRGGA
mmetsp:Transcript_13298/g.31714  ORF Transcript_13298/g.31714 Transcript_13298/m.31714 type:complete len:348 (+) Transcript_13298:2197-3240(+)